MSYQPSRHIGDVDGQHDEDRNADRIGKDRPRKVNFLNDKAVQVRVEEVARERDRQVAEKRRSRGKSVDARIENRSRSGGDTALERMRYCSERRLEGVADPGAFDAFLDAVNDVLGVAAGAMRSIAQRATLKRISTKIRT